VHKLATKRVIELEIPYTIILLLLLLLSLLEKLASLRSASAEYKTEEK